MREVFELASDRIERYVGDNAEEIFVGLVERELKNDSNKDWTTAAIALAEKCPELYEAYRRNMLKGRRNG